MSCSNKCVPAFAVAINSKFNEATARDQLCAAVDYVAYVKLLVDTDMGQGLDSPSVATQIAVVKLINDLNAINKLFKGPAGPGGAETALQWGLSMTVSCRLVTILIRDCYASSNDANFTLANLAQATPVNYSTAEDKSFSEFLCCLGDSLKTFACFLSSYTSASGC